MTNDERNAIIEECAAQCDAEARNGSRYTRLTAASLAVVIRALKDAPQDEQPKQAQVRTPLVPMEIIVALNSATGGNEWQGDATRAELLEPARQAILNLAESTQAPQDNDRQGTGAMRSTPYRNGIRDGFHGRSCCPILYGERGQKNYAQGIEEGKRRFNSGEWSAWHTMIPYELRNSKEQK